MKNKFNYEWLLSKDYPRKKNGYTVFSCFACGGGSTMGYKLAGFDVIGCNEIDPRMMEVYKINHNPKYSFLEGIQTFKNKEELPPELFDLDILDGSPPCSSFSMAGNRDADWGKEKKFKEGQAEQVLDTLFFDFIDLTYRLQPKIAVAENVKGLLMGKAKQYVSRIYKAFDAAGYCVNHFLLDASTMGIPQRRERVFFIAVRKDLVQIIRPLGFFGTCPTLDLKFREKIISFGEVRQDEVRIPLSEKDTKYWEASKNRGGSKVNGFLSVFKRKLIPTTINGTSRYTVDDTPHLLTNNELMKIGSWPLDYDFNGQRVQYLVGMSVPPVMMARIAQQIQLQLLDKVKD